MGHRLRADAQVNEDRVLEAATLAFNRDGVDTSLKAIAQDAGVGIGTLYRRFPTREQLVWAVYSNEVDRICAASPRLLTEHAAVDALRAWMDEFIDFLAAKAGLADALKAALASDDDLRLSTRATITDALAALLNAGIEQGTIRPGVDPLDVMMALGGTALIAGHASQRAQAGRMLDLLMTGLKNNTFPPAALLSTQRRICAR